METSIDLDYIVSDNQRGRNLSMDFVGGNRLCGRRLSIDLVSGNRLWRVSVREILSATMDGGQIY